MTVLGGFESVLVPLIGGLTVLPFGRTVAPRVLVPRRSDRSDRRDDVDYSDRRDYGDRRDQRDQRDHRVGASASMRFQLIFVAWLFVTAWHPYVGLGLATGAPVLRRQGMHWRERRRDRRVQAELPEILHDIARRLRAGYSAPLAFAEVLGRDGAVGAHLTRSARQLLQQGEPLHAVVTQWRRDVENKVGPSVLDDLVVAVELAEVVGGLRASALEVVADTASERHALADETKAQASQAKASAMVMTLAPIVFCAQMVLRDPQASRLLLRTPVGWVLLFIGASLDAMAWLWMKRLTSERRQRHRSRTVRTVNTLGASMTRSRLAATGESPLGWVAGVRWMLFGRQSSQQRLRDFASADRSTARRPVSASLILRIGTLAERALWRAARSVGGGVRDVERVFGAASIERTRRLGISVLVMPPLLVLRPSFAVVALGVVIVGPIAQRTLIARRLRAQRNQETAQTIELVRLALESGATPSLALIAVARVAGPALRGPLEISAHELRHGESIDTVLRELAHQVPELRSLCDVLVASSRLGLGVGETLRGLAVEARAARRRLAEAHARRLPVVLLFPVVCLTLPAFVVLTVVPLLLTGLGSLRF